MGKPDRYRNALEEIAKMELAVPEGWGAEEWYRTVAYEHVGIAAGALEDEGELTTPPLPDWDDLRGLAPDATGTLSSEDFVRELRDGWC